MERVLVLMSTYNGERFLKEQINSILQQEKVSVSVLVRDDGSSDRTKELLRGYRNTDKVEWYQGENIKPAQSFCQLVENCPDDYEYYAYADQDDIWNRKKLSYAVNALKDVKSQALWFCRADKLVGSDVVGGGYCSLEKASSLEAVLCTFATTNGCTMVFNRELLNVLRSCEPGEVDMHDSWTHAMCLACGGKIICDEKVLQVYRIHEGQVLGGNDSFHKKVYRFLHPNRLRCKTVKRMLTSNYIKEDNKTLLNIFSDYNKNLKHKVMLLRMKKPIALTDKQFIKFKIQILLNKY